jgi:hypothetical protein
VAGVLTPLHSVEAVVASTPIKQTQDLAAPTMMVNNPRAKFVTRLDTSWIDAGTCMMRVMFLIPGM